MASSKSSPLKRTFGDAGLENTIQHQLATSTFANDRSRTPVFQTTDNPEYRGLLTEQERQTTPSRHHNMELTAGDARPQAIFGQHVGANTSRRQKLTFAQKEARKAESEARRVEKEAKDRQKAEQKAERDTEKRVKYAEKDAEKQLKEVEKEEKRKARDEQARLKEEEKQRREDEKNKKTKSQLSLNAFFVQPPVSKGGFVGSPNHEGHTPASSRRSSLSSIGGTEGMPRGRSTSLTPQNVHLPEYGRLYPPFFVQSHTVLAPYSRFSRHEESLQYVKKKIDEGLATEGDLSEKQELGINSYNLFHISAHNLNRFKRRRRPQRSVKEIVAMINGTAQDIMDPTTSSPERQPGGPAALLRCLPTKYLRFAEDVRPPYIGTYTKLSNGHTIAKLRRNPFTKGLPRMDYDYDSEVEWEEPGEGEDLDSEGEEEVGEDEEGDEMEGFLDDDDAGDGSRAPNQKRRPIMGDLEPACTGICWEGVITEANNLATVARSTAVDLQSYKLEVILDHLQLPIDPYSKAYWQTVTNKSHEMSTSSSLQTCMDPPRIPLNAINRINALIPNPSLPVDGLKAPSPSADIPMSVKPPKAPKRLVAPDVMEDFKVAVQGNDLTKAGLVEILKKRFPKQSKDAIKDTLSLIAERVGSREADKRWVIKAGY